MSDEAGKGDKRRPGDQDAYANNYNAIFGKKKAKTAHTIKYQGNSSHENEDWYKCIKCGKSDWIASYGTLSQLSFYDQPCE